MNRTADVARVDFGGCVLLCDDGRVLDAKVRGKLMGPRKSLGNAVVPGDRARYVLEHGRALVEEVLPRKNVFSRRAPGARPAEQVVAANLDRVVVVASILHPEFKAGLCDRVLAQAQHCGIECALVVTKTDLARPAEVRVLLDDYRAAGYAAHATSTVSGAGIEPLREAWRGRRSLLVGHSGVGKSTLLNALVPGLELLAGLVNAKTLKGRHTTSATWLVRPQPGTDLIDTPGVRAFGLWGIGCRDLERAYPEFRRYLGKCRFTNCRHEGDAGCALRAALDGGAIAARRFESFLKLRAELEREESGELERVRPTTRFRR